MMVTFNDVRDMLNFEKNMISLRRFDSCDYKHFVKGGFMRVNRKV